MSFMSDTPGTRERLSMLPYRVPFSPQVWTLKPYILPTVRKMLDSPGQAGTGWLYKSAGRETRERCSPLHRAGSPGSAQLELSPLPFSVGWECAVASREVGLPEKQGLERKQVQWHHHVPEATRPGKHVTLGPCACSPVRDFVHGHYIPCLGNGVQSQDRVRSQRCRRQDQEKE